MRINSFTLLKWCDLKNQDSQRMEMNAPTRSYLGWLIVALALAPLCSTPAADNSPSQEWVKSIAASKDPGRNGVAVDQKGNVYLAGGKPQPSTIEPVKPIAGALVLSKYSGSGELNWRKEAIPAKYEFAVTSVAADSVGNILVTGSARGAFSIDGTEVDISSSFGRNAFVLKFDSAGKLMWLQTINCADESFAQALAVDGSGAAYVTGYFSTKAKFGQLELDNGPVQKGPTSFLVKYSKDGCPDWVRAANLTNVGYSLAAGVCLTGNENIVVTGNFAGQADFGSTVLKSESHADRMFLACFDKNGVVVWAKDAGGVGNSNVDGKAVASDHAGNIYVTGNFFGKVSFGSNAITSLGEANIFLAKYSPDGNASWVRRVTGTGWNEGTCVAVDLHDKPLIGGCFYETNRFDDISVVSRGIYDAFVASYSGDGSVIWVKQIGGPGWDKTENLAIDKSDNIYVTGSHAPGAFEKPENMSQVKGEEATNVFLLKLKMP